MKRLVLLALFAVGCGGEAATHDPYEPAHLDPEAKHVTFTREGAARTGLETAMVQRRGSRLVVPYAALVYDQQGASFVYTSPEPLTYLRVPVSVDLVAGDEVLLTRGPRPGTAVVTVGATEVYGAELGIAGGH